MGVGGGPLGGAAAPCITDETGRVLDPAPETGSLETATLRVTNAGGQSPPRSGLQSLVQA